jgi:hypothetical protein
VSVSGEHADDDSTLVYVDGLVDLGAELTRALWT